MSNWYSSFWFDRKTSVDDIIAKYDNNNDVDYVDGTVFEETDTGKAYIWNATTKVWIEII